MVRWDSLHCSVTIEQSNQVHKFSTMPSTYSQPKGSGKDLNDPYNNLHHDKYVFQKIVLTSYDYDEGESLYKG
jgi:hypothetical protein